MSRGSSDDVQVVVRAVDEFSKAMLAFKEQLKGQADQAAKTEQAVGKMSSRFSAFGSVLQGMAVGAGIKLFDTLANAVGQLVDLLPNLIGQGNEYVRVIHDLQLVTGMSAEQTSTLVAAFQEFGVNLDDVTVLFARFSKNIADNEKDLTALGVATRNQNGDLLSAYDIFTGLRHVVQQHGESILSTAAAQDIFGRSGYKMLEVLGLTDEQFKQLAADAAASGLVLDQQAIEAGHRFDITLARLGAQVQGAATQIFEAVEPTLEALINGFTNFVQAHLNEIVQFAVTVVNFIGGLIGGLLGIDFAAATFAGTMTEAAGATDTAATSATNFGKAAGGAAKGEDAFTKSTNKAIDAIQRQIDAIDARRKARDAEKQEAELEKAIADAEQELANLQASALNTYGLSAAEKVKAEQKRQADILAAQQKIQDAKDKLTENSVEVAEDAEKAKLELQKKALQDALTAHRQFASGVAGTVPPIKQAAKDIQTAFQKHLEGKDGVGGMLADFTQAANDARTAGITLAGNLKDIGKTIGDLGAPFASLKSVVSGPLGIITAIAGFSVKVGDFRLNVLDLIGLLPGNWFLTVANHLSDVGNILSGIPGGLATAIANMVKYLQSLPVIGKYFKGEVLGTTENNLFPPPSNSGGGSTTPPPTSSTPPKQKGLAAGGVIGPGDYGTVGEEGIEDFSSDAYGNVTIRPRASGGGFEPATIVRAVVNGRQFDLILDEALYRRRRLAPAGL